RRTQRRLCALGFGRRALWVKTRSIHLNVPDTRRSSPLEHPAQVQFTTGLPIESVSICVHPWLKHTSQYHLTVASWLGLKPRANSSRPPPGPCPRQIPSLPDLLRSQYRDAPFPATIARVPLRKTSPFHPFDKQ